MEHKFYKAVYKYLRFHLICVCAQACIGRWDCIMSVENWLQSGLSFYHVGSKVGIHIVRPLEAPLPAEPSPQLKCLNWSIPVNRHWFQEDLEIGIKLSYVEKKKKTKIHLATKLIQYNSHFRQHTTFTFLFCETYYVVLGGPELIVQTRVALNSDPPASSCFQSARID